MQKIFIKSKLYDYSVEFVQNFADVLAATESDSVFVIDENVFRLYQQKFNCINRERIYLMKAEENRKNMQTVMEIINFWKSLGVRKNYKVYCFGGGITQDVTTIASNLYLRNIEWNFFPTTLLSMCDSCIGGKSGINLVQYKNQIGVFYPPRKIFIDTSFIDTLTRQDYLNGWGEILKFSLTKDPAFYDEIKSLKQYIPCENIARYIHMGLQVKQEIIEQDEFESDLRRVLNYGHTFGHALEAYTNNKIPHGEGVIWGIDAANFLAMKEGLLSPAIYQDVKDFIKRAFIQNEIEISKPDELFAIICTDKKVRGNTLSFAMLNGPSRLIIHPMKIDDRLRELFHEYLEATHEYYGH